MPRGVPKPKVPSSVPSQISPPSPVSSTEGVLQDKLAAAGLPVEPPATKVKDSWTPVDPGALIKSLTEPPPIRRTTKVTPLRPAEVNTGIRTSSGSSIYLRDNPRYSKISLSDDDVVLEFAVEDIPKLIEGLKTFELKKE